MFTPPAKVRAVCAAFASLFTRPSWRRAQARLCALPVHQIGGISIYAAGQWLVLSGLHGRAKRIFTLSTEQALDYQRHIAAPVNKRPTGRWLRFGLWYWRWRKQVFRLGINQEAAYP